MTYRDALTRWAENQLVENHKCFPMEIDHATVSVNFSFDKGQALDEGGGPSYAGVIIRARLDEDATRRKVEANNYSSLGVEPTVYKIMRDGKGWGVYLDLTDTRSRDIDISELLTEIETFDPDYRKRG